MKLFLCSKKKGQSKHDPEITWKDLMESRGLALWTLRTRAVLGTTKYPFVELPLRKRGFLECSSPPSVAVITCPHFFHALEEEQDAIFLSRTQSTIKGNVDESHRTHQSIECHHGLDKPRDFNPGRPRPLTRCTGEEWTRQRQEVKKAFENLPARSLEAIRNVDMDRIILAASTGKQQDGEDMICEFDCNCVAQSIALEWVVRLFGGSFSSAQSTDKTTEPPTNTSEKRLEQTLYEYWKSIRSERPVTQDTISKHRGNAMTSLKTGGGGVLDSLFASGLSEQDARDNALNAMIAAFDAAQSLLFWTIVNLARTKSGWEKSRQCALDQEFYQTNLEGLARFKQAATRGDTVDYADLSYLGRALCETVRAYPPVWTLPRTWPIESKLVDLSKHHFVQWSKVDVPTINKAKNPYKDWNPDIVQPNHVASFGLGRRHCPAGTAALYAVYHALTEVLKRVEHVDCTSEWKNPVDSVVLLPTLSIGQPNFPFYKAKLCKSAAEAT